MGTYYNVHINICFSHYTCTRLTGARCRCSIDQQTHRFAPSTSLESLRQLSCWPKLIHVTQCDTVSHAVRYERGISHIASHRRVAIYSGWGSLLFKKVFEESLWKYARVTSQSKWVTSHSCMCRVRCVWHRPWICVTTTTHVVHCICESILWLYFSAFYKKNVNRNHQICLQLARYVSNLPPQLIRIQFEHF